MNINTSPRFDCKVLKLLAKLYGARLKERRFARLQRLAFLQQIRDYAEDGQIAVVWSGMDCDGVRYSGDVRMVSATKQDVTEHIDHVYEWADGPCVYSLMRPSCARELEYQSRDLAAEAHEDGHSHCLFG